MAAWGARRAIALDLFGPMTDSHRRLLDSHFPRLRRIVLPVRGDAQAMPVKSASVDLLISIEAVSHDYDVDAFLDECARVVRPGGTLLISDGNNGANPALRRFTEQLWERFEVGPTGPFGDHVVEETMVARRASIIAARFPELAPERVRSLAEATSGMVRTEIEQAVASHLAGGPAPAARYRFGMVPRDPHWGSVAEALVAPRVLAAQIERRGFHARAIPHYGGARKPPDSGGRPRAAAGAELPARARLSDRCTASLKPAAKPGRWSWAARAGRHAHRAARLPARPSHC